MLDYSRSALEKHVHFQFIGLNGQFTHKYDEKQHNSRAETDLDIDHTCTLPQE